MKISVIIPTYNGSDRIMNTLKSLENQTEKNFQLIISIDGSTDNTEDVVISAKPHFKDFQVINHPNGGRAVARNRGAKAAMGELLVFFDDDMRPEPDCIEKHMAYHQINKDCLLTGRQLEDTALMKTDIQFYKAHLSQKWLKQIPQGSLSNKNLFFTAAHCSMSAEVFWRLGGFDKSLTDCEDYDLALRALKSNIEVHYSPLFTAWHDDFISLKKFVTRQKEYTASRKRLCLKYNYSSSFNQQLSFFKRLFLQPFRNRMWPYFVDHTKILSVFPRGIRYKIYDLVITAASL